MRRVYSYGAVVAISDSPASAADAIGKHTGQDITVLQVTEVTGGLTLFDEDLGADVPVTVQAYAMSAPRNSLGIVTED